MKLRNLQVKDQKQYTSAPDANAFTFYFEGKPINAKLGDSVAAALLEAGELALRVEPDGSHRGVVCSIGVCWECRCIIDGVPNTRACQTKARPGMEVLRQREDS